MVKRTRKRNSSRRRNSTRKYSRRRNSARKYSRKRNKYRNNTRRRNTRRRNTRRRNIRKTRSRNQKGGWGEWQPKGWELILQEDGQYPYVFEPSQAETYSTDNKVTIKNMIAKKNTFSLKSGDYVFTCLSEDFKDSVDVAQMASRDLTFPPGAVRVAPPGYINWKDHDGFYLVQFPNVIAQKSDKPGINYSLYQVIPDSIPLPELQQVAPELEPEPERMLSEEYLRRSYPTMTPVGAVTAQSAALASSSSNVDFIKSQLLGMGYSSLDVNNSFDKLGPDKDINTYMTDIEGEIRDRQNKSGIEEPPLKHAAKGIKPYEIATNFLLNIGYPEDLVLEQMEEKTGAGYKGSTAYEKAKAVVEHFDGQGILPEGWEVRFTESGQPYYVNHNTKTTQWEHPTKSELKAQLGTDTGLDPHGSTVVSGELGISDEEIAAARELQAQLDARGKQIQSQPEPQPQPAVALPQRAVAAASLEPQGVTHSSIIYGDPISTLHQLRDAVPGTLVLFDIDDTLIRREKSWVRKWDDTLRKYVDVYEPQVRSLDEDLPPLLEQLTRRDVSILALTARYHNEHRVTKEELGSEISKNLVQSSKFSDLVWSDGEDKKYEEGIIYCTDRQVAGVDPKVHAFKQLQDYFLRKGIINIIYVDDLKDHIDHMSAYFKTLPIDTLVVQYTLGSQLSFLSDMKLTDQEDKPEQYLIDEALTRLKGGETLLDVKTDIGQKSDAIKTLLNYGFTREFATANVNAIREMIIAEALANPGVDSYKFWTDHNIVQKARNIQSGLPQ